MTERNQEREEQVVRMKLHKGARLLIGTIEENIAYSNLPKGDFILHKLHEHHGFVSIDKGSSQRIQFDFATNFGKTVLQQKRRRRTYSPSSH